MAPLDPTSLAIGKLLAMQRQAQRDRDQIIATQREQGRELKLIKLRIDKYDVLKNRAIGAWMAITALWAAVVAVAGFLWVHGVPEWVREFLQRRL